MEDVLSLYEQPYDPKCPVICFDEKPCQLIGETIAPIPVRSGKTKKENYEYIRNGTCCIFVAFEPRSGRRLIRVRERRTKIDYALFMEELIQNYPDAEFVRLVQDNLNTHSAASFYEAFPPEKAFDLANRFEYHFTPKKGSWLNMAEIELSALSRQCLNRRIGDIKTLAEEIGYWESDRNKARAMVKWNFSKKNAREKLHRHYPIVQN